MKHLVKLVRNGIIEKIRQKGEPAAYRQTTEEEFKILIVEKLIEESKEILEAIKASKGREVVISEAADLQDAFEAFLEVQRISISDLMRRQVEKRRELGGFEGRWALNVLF